MEQANRVNQKNTKSNRNYDKENFVNNHKKSKVKSIVDERTTEIKILISHKSRACFNKTIELHQLEYTKTKWERDGYEIKIVN